MSELLEEKRVPSKHKVGVSLGYTRNMGNFESLRVDVSLELDGAGNPQVTFDKVYSWVEERLVEKVRELEEEVREVKK